MKFDVVVGNPPYQQPQEHEGKRGGGTTLWDKFVHQAVNGLVKPDGYVCFIHPCGWRAPKGAYSETKDIILGNQIHYLQIHDASDGLKTFGAGTRYDWYVLQKTTPKIPTTVLTEDGKTVVKDITKLPFIPNAMFDEVMGLIAKPGEEKVNVLHSYSDYESRKPWVSKTQSSTFKYPVIHSIKKAGLNIIWSSENRGMIGFPKVVFGCGQSDTYVDNNGEYGLSQHTRGIIDSPENLENINKALNNEKFIQISSACNLVSTGMFVDKYNKDVISLFRKDFWKGFV